MATLQDEVNKAATTPEISTPTKKDETVELTKSDFQGLIATVQKLQGEVTTLKERGGESIALPSVKTRKAKIHTFKGEVITDVGKAWEIIDQYGAPEMRLEVFTGDKKHEVKYKGFTDDLEEFGFMSEQAVIKEIKVIDEGEVIQGYTDLIRVDYDNYRSSSLGKVPVKVTTPKYMYLMTRENGEDVEINPNALN